MLLSLQALPLVSVFVGRENGTSQCRVVSLADGIDSPNYVEFPAPSGGTPLEPGSPKWANYVKGVVANYKGTFKYQDFRQVNGEIKGKTIFLYK